MAAAVPRGASGAAGSEAMRTVPGRGLVSLFVRHPNAANLLMVLMLMFGIFAIERIGTQFFPTIDRPNVTVSVSWTGASASDVAEGVLEVVEPAVRFVDGVEEMVSYAREGSGTVNLTFAEGTDMDEAVRELETAVATIGNLPEEAERPEVRRSVWYDSVATLAVAGAAPERVLRDWAQRIRDDLMDRGIDRVDITGLRAEEVIVRVPERELRRLGLSISDVSQRIAANSRDRPSGSVDGAVERQLRALADIESRGGLGRVEVVALPSGDKILLGDIASIEPGFDADAVRGFSGSNPAIELEIKRSAATDTLAAAAILDAYLDEIRPQLPANVELMTYDVRADAVADRISLLIENGALGLLIVVVMLFLFLDARIAFWVAMGIPVAMSATLGLMWLMGQSINMVSLFALIMMLGVIVDDAIVVGEHTDTRLAMGDGPFEAAENGAGAMVTPVMAAMATTIAAFAPILIMGDVMGQMASPIPFVAVAVIIASLIECFLILPGHLSHSVAKARSRSGRVSVVRLMAIALVVGAFLIVLARSGADWAAVMDDGEGRLAGALGSWPGAIAAALGEWREGWGPVGFTLAIAACGLLLAGLIELTVWTLGTWRRRRPDRPPLYRRAIDAAFDAFRDGPFSWVVRLSYRWRYVTLAVAVALGLSVAHGLRGGEHVRFAFFPSPESERINARVTFNAGIPEDEAVRILGLYEDALGRAVERLRTSPDERVVRAVFVTLGQSGRSRGDNVARLQVQLTTSEERSVRTPAITRAWQVEAPDLPGVQRFSVFESRGGPPGRDVDILLQGSDLDVLKLATAEIIPLVSDIDGVSGVADDLPYGKPELVMRLTPRGGALGFSIEEVGRQVRDAFEGAVPRRYARGGEEVTVRVEQAMRESGSAALRNFELRAPGGGAFVPLSEVVELTERQGFSAIQRRDGKSTVSITGDVDLALNTTDGVLDELRQGGRLDAIASRYDITYRFDGRAREQRRSLDELRTGTFVALGVIYIILAWVFGSYFRPFAVMLIIPFGYVGAVFGHWAMGFDLTIFSLIGLLGLAGILVNDSIILVSRLDERLRAGDDLEEAAVGASRDRLRAVLLTSLTTIGGLMPLMWETSLQAQFLLPMAITIVFGLGLATLLVLFIVPALVGVGGDIRASLSWIFGDATGRTGRRHAPDDARPRPMEPAE